MAFLVTHNALECPPKKVLAYNNVRASISPSCTILRVRVGQTTKTSQVQNALFSQMFFFWILFCCSVLDSIFFQLPFLPLTFLG